MELKAYDRFELAVDAVVDGDLVGLNAILREHPELVRMRSSGVTEFDATPHRATLLHYVAANGVEAYRQKTPPNAVAVAQALLEAGAEVDALADLYGGECTTMSLLVSSCHPAEAGLQVALVDLLVDFGGSVEAVGRGNWTSPLLTALVFGYREAAEALIRRGARVERLAMAAGMGMVEEILLLLGSADAKGRHRALALAAQLRQESMVRLLIGAGEDVNRCKPEGMHAHSTPLHQAVGAGQFGMVRLLVERGARMDIQDLIDQGTALGWTEHCGKLETAAYLRERGAQ